MAGVLFVTYQAKPAASHQPELAGFFPDTTDKALALATAQERVASYKKLPLDVVKMMYWWDTETHAEVKDVQPGATAAPAAREDVAP